MGSIPSDANSSLSNDVLLVNLPMPADEAWITKMESRYSGLRVRWVERSKWNAGSQGVPPEMWEGVTIVVGAPPHPAHLMTNVRYVQLSSAGADRWLEQDLYKNPDVIFCTANGCHPPQIAEWVIATWLMKSHRLLDYHVFQKEERWNKVLYSDIADSPGLRMGILGYGAIGRHVARISSAMGMEIYAYTRTERSTPESKKDDSYYVPGTGDPDGLIPAKWFHGSSKEAIDDFLSQDLDVLVLCMPLTPATKKMLGKEQFDILARKKTFVSNIGRGKLIDTDALLEALEQGKIQGAALDVTDPEPLPDGHPLWKAPNVYITPHVSWQTPHYIRRVLDILETNLEKMDKGERMLNIMNREHNY
ncbi:hypothetical protein GQ53DRAFT_747514 [Thozetella sp. PMI_491]|nr:hypothetical protein GQ53DRAFT_747514 [Thozetella sp. PMI_491]